MNQTIQGYNQKIIEACIDYFITLADGNVSDSDVIKHVAVIVECSGGQLDACSSCGAMPMTSNCNNARCQDTR